MDLEPNGVAQEEANHRFLNTLTTLRGLLRTDFEAFEDDQVRSAVARFDGHIMAFAGLHRSLGGTYQAPGLDVVTHFGELCRQLADALLAPRGIHCAFAADEGCIDARTGEKLGLIIVELVTNAAKHAFTGRQSGCVCISLRQSPQAWTCVVGDNGVGMGLGTGGAGRRLVQALAREIKAELTTVSDARGVTVTVAAPDVSLVHA